jgi:hypothetical protein
VTGTIKNALDWLVSFEPFIHLATLVAEAVAALRAEIVRQRQGGVPVFPLS